MDNDHAKLVLGVYRTNGNDAGDPFFADALKQAETDPSLRQWLNEQQWFDTEMAAALGAIAGPVEGKKMIKAAMGASSRSHRRWWWPVALAASFAILLTSAVIFRRSGELQLPGNASLAELAATMSEHHASIGLMSSDVESLRKWITVHGGPLPDHLPPGLTQMMALGCQTWKTSRGKISLLCFVGQNHAMVHLYIFDMPGEGSSLPPLANPRYEKVGRWSLAVWQDRDRAYVMGTPSGPGSDETLAGLFRA